MTKNDNNEPNLHKELSELKNTVAELARVYAQSVGDKLDKIPTYIHEQEDQLVHSVQKNPLASIGVAAFVGFILGAVLTRR